MIDVILTIGPHSDAIASFLRDFSDYRVTECSSSNLPITMAKGHYDIALVHEGPKESKIRNLKKAIEIDSHIPIILICENKDDDTLVKAFRVGAADVVSIPFSFAELQCRIKAILRRTYALTKAQRYIIGDFTLYPPLKKLLYKGRQISIASKESVILELFFSQPNSVIARKDILKRGWEKENFYTSKSLDAFIHKIRDKLSVDPKVSLDNVRGVGYKLNVPFMV